MHAQFKAMTVLGGKDTSAWNCSVLRHLCQRTMTRDQQWQLHWHSHKAMGVYAMGVYACLWPKFMVSCMLRRWGGGRALPAGRWRGRGDPARVLSPARATRA